MESLRKKWRVSAWSSIMACLQNKYKSVRQPPSPSPGNSAPFGDSWAACWRFFRSEKMESVCLVVDHGLPTEQIQVSSTASIAIARELGAFWRFMGSMLAILPLSLRDWGYNLIARYRYRIFGKYDTCPLPDPRNRHKFLDVA